MSVKWLKVSFGAEVIVFVLCAALTALEGARLWNLLLLLFIFLISLTTFMILYRHMKKD